MSVVDRYGLATRQRRAVAAHTGSLRLLALGGLGVATVSYLSVLLHVTSVVGGRGRLLAIALIAFLAAYGAARLLTPAVAAAIAVVSLVIGTAVYAVAVPGHVQTLLQVGALVQDWLAILSGYTVLAIVAADVWAAAIAPAPIFLSWYLAFRGEYALGAAIAGAAMGLFMLSGDLAFPTALLGVLGIAGTIGFGELARRRATLGQSDLVVVVLAAMLVGSLLVPLVPAEGGQPIRPGSEIGADTSLEGALIGSDEEITVTGSPSLDPGVRFTVSSPVEARWRVDAYDRYTGDGWVQTGDARPMDGSGPETGRVQSIEMAVRAEQAGVAKLPTVWQPTDVDGVTGVGMTSEDGLIATAPLAEGESYFVSVERPDVLRGQMSAMEGNETPDELQERYTQLPDSTPDEVGEVSAEIVEKADNPYEAAERVEQYLRTTNNYSLDVSAPQGDIAYEMLYERDAGYCVYFATTMVAMLRSQDIPARFVTGYSAGEQVASDEWVVRGMDAHAWVEVYIAGVGWVEFDPTPTDPYRAERIERLENAREGGAGDTRIEPSNEPAFEEWEPEIDLPPVPDRNQERTETEEIQARADELRIHCGDRRALEEGEITVEEALIVCSADENEIMGVYDEIGLENNESLPDGAVDTNTTNGTDPLEDRQQPIDIDDPLEDEETGQGPADEERPSRLPSAEQLGIVLALGVGAAVGVRRSGVGRRIRYEVALRWQGLGRDPRGAVERAWRRLELHLGEVASPREPEEPVRAYVQRLERDPSTATDIDERVYTVIDAYEQARYSDDPVSAARAREAVRAVDELIDRRAPRLRR